MFARSSSLLSVCIEIPCTCCWRTSNLNISRLSGERATAKQPLVCAAVTGPALASLAPCGRVCWPQVAGVASALR